MYKCLYIYVCVCVCVHVVSIHKDTETHIYTDTCTHMVGHLDMYNGYMCVCICYVYIYVHMCMDMVLLSDNAGCRAVSLACSHLYVKNRITYTIIYICIYIIILLSFYYLSRIFDKFGISHICESMFHFGIFFPRLS